MTLGAESSVPVALIAYIFYSLVLIFFFAKSNFSILNTKITDLWVHKFFWRGRIYKIISQLSRSYFIWAVLPCLGTMLCHLTNKVNFFSQFGFNSANLGILMDTCKMLFLLCSVTYWNCFVKVTHVQLTSWKNPPPLDSIQLDYVPCLVLHGISVLRILDVPYGGW